MGFFDKIFGKKNNDEIETTLDLLPSLIKNKFDLQEQTITQYNAKKISEIKHLHRKAILLLEDIQKKEIQEAKNAKFNKAAITAKSQIEKQLKHLLEKLSPNNRGHDLNDARAYAGEGYALMITEINSFRKSIVYTSAFLKDEMSELGQILQEMINCFNEMNQTFKKNSILFEFEKIQKDIENIKEEKKEILEFNKNIENNEKLIKEKHILLDNKKNDLENYSKSPEMKRLKEIEYERTKLIEKKQDLKLQVYSLISSVDRPLQRFKSLIDSKRWVLKNDENEILELVLTNPLIALKKDPKAKKFKSILKEVKKAIEDKKVELKEKEKEKRLNALDELLTFDFFENVFWKLNEIQKEQDKLNKEISTNLSQIEFNNKTKSINELNKEIELLLESNKIIEQKILNKNEHIFKKIERIKLFSENALNKNIKINY
jgi:hypothetical protein